MFIEVHNVTKTFGHNSGLVTAINDVSFSIREGENIAICGPSGSGKSTLLNVLCGLLHPDSGSVIVDEIDLYSDLKSDGLARFRSEYIGFVFQAFHLVPYLTAFENTILPLAHLDIRRRDKFDMAKAVMEKVGLTDRMKHLPSELSGGQQQRVAIARALVNEPPIIVADEPTGNLDGETSGEILDLFKRLNSEGHTIITVTHDEATLAFSDRQIRIVDGQIAKAESKLTVRSS